MYVKFTLMVTILILYNVYAHVWYSFIFWSTIDCAYHANYIISLREIVASISIINTLLSMF